MRDETQTTTTVVRTASLTQSNPTLTCQTNSRGLYPYTPIDGVEPKVHSEELYNTLAALPPSGVGFPADVLQSTQNIEHTPGGVRVCHVW